MIMHKAIALSMLFYLVSYSAKSQLTIKDFKLCLDNSGNADDSSGNGYNGNVNGATLTTDRFGNANNAYYFNGVNNYISIKPFSVNTFSLSCWICDSSINTTNLNGIISRLNATPYKGFEFRVEPDSTLMLVCGTGNTWIQPTTPFKLSDNAWYHVVATNDNNMIKIYVNANLIASYAFSNYADNNDSIVIGTRNPAVWNGGWYNGKIDDIRIYNRALNQQEISYLATH